MPRDWGSGQPDDDQRPRTWPALEISEAGAADLIQAFLTDFAVSAIDDNIPGRLSIFFFDAAERDRASAELRVRFPEVVVHSIDLLDDDWAARSQADLRSIRVGNIIVTPPWDADVAAAAGGIRIVIQPSMGFGTGHHATTRLCLLALQQIDLHGLRAIDVGTGSGVLAIASSRLGAASVVGIDDDVHALQAARESLALNPDADVTLKATDLRSADIGQFDVVIANLTGGLLIAAAQSLQSLTVPAGCLILSGFMDHEEAGVRLAYDQFAVEWNAQEDEWRCVRIRARR